MAKQLRLDVAQLTDVGRRREHNEDNMAYVIPKDTQVMALKGSLFIVADGMGGHAAGEVASEIAVDTVSTVYYQDDSDDVSVALVHAIKRANSAIHQRAAENMLRSGMGTTCVSAVMRGNMAYVANVGDSRAYLVRGGVVRQVSQDHSWVAEQVRAGLLTEDQARTHAQRNVITRSLGTQPDVEIDIFTEPLQEGDSLILCSDGLSGQITEEELLRIVNQFIPQESVYHLVERANENGGPDNITAIVVRVNEVGYDPPGVPRPIPVGGPEQDTAIINMPAPVRVSNGHSSPLALPASPSGPLANDGLTAPQPLVGIVNAKRRHSRLFYPTIALLVVFILALASGALYYFVIRSSPNADQALAQAQQLLNQAKSEGTNSPTQALQHLSSAQHTLHGLQGQQLNDAQHSQLVSLQNNLKTVTQAVIISYNHHFSITALPCSGTTSSAISNTNPDTQARTIIALQAKGNTMLYALGEDNNIYRLTQVNNQYNLIDRLQVNGQVINAVGSSDGTQLLMLVSATGGYSIASVAAGQTNVKYVPIDSNLTSTNGVAPSLISSWDKDIYVVFASKQVANSAQIVDYDRDKLISKAPPTTLSANIISLAAFPGNQLFLLQGDGTIVNLPFSNKQAVPVPVVVPRAIPTPLPISGATYATATPVPTIAVPNTQDNPTPLQVSNKGTLTAGNVNGVTHLYIADATNHTLLDLTQTGGGTAIGGGNTPTPPSNNPSIMLQLNQQYSSPTLFVNLRNNQVDPANGNTLYVLSQTTGSLLNLVLINTNSQNTCP